MHNGQTQDTLPIAKISRAKRGMLSRIVDLDLVNLTVLPLLSIPVENPKYAHRHHTMHRQHDLALLIPTFVTGDSIRAIDLRVTPTHTRSPRHTVYPPRTGVRTSFS